MAKRILIIDDEAPILEAVQMILSDMGYEVVAHADADEGIQAARQQRFDLMLVDVRMPHKNGAAVTRALLQDTPEAYILIITAFPGDPVAAEAMQAGARGIIKKPFEIAKILDALRE
ncbi:response regulator [Spirochaeta africana]|uniref:Response regulator with CheY-like receiver, AAA-type ATPase, and DNA-binding domains n=1 Tax=Spirochaeta africana (strain ATCC 700263 / DSM 8902 / Z-7692) TaxID=889378 RepID=H9ULE5_SPIAZ|nr:response regulator [Spirochaeta africana]AFG38338.1 response regulator with CheY-like receiver, AAA-type ATPase, and DNA-binding domains [Spirochaeta africana DSM 8902]